MITIRMPLMPPPIITPSYNDLIDIAVITSFKNLFNLFIYLRLIDYNSFWFSPVGIIENYIYGYMWDEYGWIYKRINMSNIEAFF